MRGGSRSSREQPLADLWRAPAPPERVWGADQGDRYDG